MTIVVTTSEPVGQLLSSDEYDALPPNARRELVDGVVQLMATPTPFHHRVARLLSNALDRMGPDDPVVVGEVEIRLDETHRRNPDVVVARALGFDWHHPRLRPDQVVLAVEVMSPGSESADRILKPIEYAAAGIEHYWRVELERTGIFFTYRLLDGQYTETGAFASGDVVAAPGLEWAAIVVDDLID